MLLSANENETNNSHCLCDHCNRGNRDDPAALAAECFEPFLQVYDKVYKNMGFGNGIFSWCRRPPQKK